MLIIYEKKTKNTEREKLYDPKFGYDRQLRLALEKQLLINKV